MTHGVSALDQSEAQELQIALQEWIKPSSTTIADTRWNSEYYQDDYEPLHLSTAVGDLVTVKYLVGNGVDVSSQSSSSCIIPQLCSLHIAVRYGYEDIIKYLIMQADCNVNKQDQWGFTPLHYAVITRNKAVIMHLIGHGSSAIIKSKLGSTPLELAKALNYDDIIDILASKETSESDPTLPQFRSWLCSLGAGEYLAKFLEAGYDLPFILKSGLTDQDLDCVDIPMSKLGIRRKILCLHNLSDFYSTPEGEEEDGEVENGDEDEDDEEDDGEEEDGEEQD